MEMPDELWIFKWFTTLFLYSFPLKYAIKFWDYIISETLFNSIKLALAILKRFEK